MKTKVLICLSVICMLSCSKDKFQTTPQISIKSFSPEVVPVNSNLTIRLEFTDKEGDVNDSLWIIRQRLNRRGPVTLPPAPFKIPSFPATKKGEFEVVLRYQFELVFGMSSIPIPGTNPVQREPDTLRLHIFVRDADGNVSDTAVLNDLYVIR